jgi:hypothetical protein
MRPRSIHGGHGASRGRAPGGELVRRQTKKTEPRSTKRAQKTPTTPAREYRAVYVQAEGTTKEQERECLRKLGMLLRQWL